MTEEKTPQKRSSFERQKRIVEILTLLHEGGSFEEAKRIFNEEFDQVDVSEITGAEKALIQGGLNPSEIQKLCNIHAAVFKGSIADIHQSSLEENQPGHPVHTMKLENQVIQSLLNDEIRWSFQKIEAGDWAYRARLEAALIDLQAIDKHYKRKETLLFSFMERYGITAPPKVMWGVDDSIRMQIKQTITLIQSHQAAVNSLRDAIEAAATEIEEMIFKEEMILLPMCLDVFSLDDWEQIEADSAEIGYSFIAPPLHWKASPAARAQAAEREPARLAAIAEAKQMTDGIVEAGTVHTVPTLQGQKNKKYNWEKSASTGEIVLTTGKLALNELIALFNALPVDLSFVDKNDIVQFFSGGERIFPRAKSVIGRRVIDCHPPKSMASVQQILDDFRTGARAHADFWIHMHGKFVYIRYVAMHDENNNDYLGCLEVSQEITEIRALEGENRLSGHVIEADPSKR